MTIYYGYNAMSLSTSPDISSPFGDALAEVELREPPHFRVILHNDDYTTMDFVVEILCSVFHKTQEQAITIMLTVHEQGRCECGVYPSEVAETKVSIVHGRARAAGYPLRCSVEEV